MLLVPHQKDVDSQYPCPSKPLFLSIPIPFLITGLFRLTINKLEQIVVNEPLALRILDQLEGLRIAHGALLLVDQELASDQDQDSLALEGGLGVQGRDSVLHLLEGEALEAETRSQNRNRHELQLGVQGLTASFSTIAVTPSDDADSKVSIELSRCIWVRLVSNPGKS